jgi:tetratricopeptide (TPR) repeat protein
MKRSISIGLGCLLVVSAMAWHRGGVSGRARAQSAREGRNLTLYFFLPGGELAVRPLEVALRMDGGGVAGERKMVVKEGRYTLSIPAGREPLVRLKVNGDGKRYAETGLTLSAREALTAYPVFLYPAGENPFSRFRPGRVSHDEEVASAARTKLERALSISGQGKMDESISEMTMVIVMAPRFTGALNQLGLTFYRGGRMMEAAAAFTQAVTLGDRSPHAYLNLGVALNRLGRYLESITLLTGLLESNPDLVRIRLPLAEALVQIQQWDAAVEMLQPALAAIESLPADLQSEAHYILARTMYREERYKAAVRELNRALAGNGVWSNTANAWLLLGSSHLELKQHGEAEKALLRAIELGGRSVIQARYRLGQLYFRENRFAEAARELDIFVRDGRNEVDPLTIRDAQVMLGNIRSGIDKGKK